MSATQFREYAIAHLYRAIAATSDSDRETFDQMARAWLEAAALWERVRAAEDEVIGRHSLHGTADPVPSLAARPIQAEGLA
jgi:hypothetical protein